MLQDNFSAIIVTVRYKNEELMQVFKINWKILLLYSVTKMYKFKRIIFLETRIEGKRILSERDKWQPKMPHSNQLRFPISIATLIL